MASNDLGVLLARCGHFAEAQLALEHSLAIRRHAEGWHNLGVVLSHLGRADLAQRAERLSQLAARSSGPASSGMAVQWLDADSFAQSFAATPGAQQELPARSASAENVVGRPAGELSGQPPAGKDSSTRQ